VVRVNFKFFGCDIYFSFPSWDVKDTNIPISEHFAAAVQPLQRPDQPLCNHMTGRTTSTMCNVQIVLFSYGFSRSGI